MIRSVSGIVGLVALFTLLPCTGYTQTLEERDNEGTNHTIVPVVGYSSDFGFLGGALYQRINYADGKKPFLSNFVADVTGSTNGKWGSMFEFERTELFERPIRTRTALQAERNPISNYFGIGNDTGYSDTDFDEGLYYLLKRRIGFQFEIRSPVFSPNNHTPVEGVFRLKSSYTNLNSEGEETQFVQSPPPGADGGWINSAGIGLMYDSRNSEFDPRRGIRSEIGADFTPGTAGNDYQFSNYFADVSGYLSVPGNTVFAQRISAEYTYGDQPFYELPTLGNKDGLRGYPINRFIGESSILYMAEVRSWLVTFLEGEVKIGGHLFYDTGRVFSTQDSAGFFKNWKRTWGFGGAFSAFNPDLILRGEIGFSEETYRIYAGVGFAF